MKTITPLEKVALTAILAEIVADKRQIERIVDCVVISSREFSMDVANEENCCGFYSTFEPNALLTDVSEIPTHVGIRGIHSSLTAGADFILFCSRSKKGLEYLEASFYGESLSTSELSLSDHGFQFIGA
jgi:hypothetical protein